MLLQIEVNQAEQEIQQLHREFPMRRKKSPPILLFFPTGAAFDLYPAVKIVEVQRRHLKTSPASTSRS
jgi:hypothetical protein